MLAMPDQDDMIHLSGLNLPRGKRRGMRSLSRFSDIESGRTLIYRLKLCKLSTLINGQWIWTYSAALKSCDGLKNKKSSPIRKSFDR